MGMRAFDDIPLAGRSSDGSPGAISLVPVVALWVACCGVYIVLSGLPVRTTPLETARQAAYLLPFALAATASLLAFLKVGQRERRLWRGLTIALAMITASEAYVSALVISGRGITTESAVLPTLMSIGAATLLIVSMFRLTDFRTLSRGVGTRHIVDAVGAGALVFGAVLALFAIPAVRRYPAFEPVSGIVASVYSVVGVFIVIAIAVNFATRGWNRWHVAEKQVIAGVGVYGIATMLWPLWYTGSALDPASLLDGMVELMWMSGALMVFSGAATRVRSGADERRFLPLPRMRPRKHGALSITLPTMFTLGIPVFGTLALVGPDDAALRIAFGVAAVGLTLVVAARSASAAIENEFLFDKAVNDPLTELFGHRYFHERLQVELELAARHGSSVSVAVVDLDGFSRVNAAHGHAYGDDVLRAVAVSIKRACRESDVVCRLGADEFAVILPAESVSGTIAVAERIRETLAALEAGESGALTASIGLATFPTDSSERDDLVRKADGALYWAKYHGKNRIVAFDESIVESLSAQDRIKKLEEQSHLGTVRALAAAVDARDSLTQFHSRNVAVLSVMLAEEMQLAEGKRQLIEVAALMHDVGKIGISDRVLRKRGPLTAAEMRHIREHPGLGEKILSSTQLDEVLPWVRHHHERWDGTGYPDGLCGEEIPLEARLLTVCDAYDAMTSGRPYREALSSTAALQEIDLCIGTQFDPAIAEAFIMMVGRRRLLRPDMISEREEYQRQA